MNRRTMTTRGRSLVVLLSVAVSSVSCGAGDEDAEAVDQDGVTKATSALVLTDNSLLAANGLGSIKNGLGSWNGLGAWNGLGTWNGLSTAAGLSPTEGLMTFPSGRNLARYIVKCAMSLGMTVKKKDETGYTYAFQGVAGVAPSWFSGPCNTACQEKVTACLIALTNRDGRRVSVALLSAAPGLSMLGTGGDDVQYPHQEGAAFGNIFVSPPKLFTCTGTESSKAEQVKRYCIDDVGCDLFTKVGSCADACTQTFTVGPGGKRIYSASVCRDPSGTSWSHPITIYLRNKVEAGNHDGSQGVITSQAYAVSSLHHGNWFRMNDIQFGAIPGAIKRVEVTLGALEAGGLIETRLDGFDGPLLGSVTVTNTGNLTTYVVHSGALTTTGITGRHPVFFSVNSPANPEGPVPGGGVGTVTFVELK